MTRGWMRVFDACTASPDSLVTFNTVNIVLCRAYDGVRTIGGWLPVRNAAVAENIRGRPGMVSTLSMTR